MESLCQAQQLCQACVNVQQECVCSEYAQEYCNDCGDKCDGVHSITRMKTIEEQAEELSKIVLSYGTHITEKVIKQLMDAINK